MTRDPRADARMSGRVAAVALVLIFLFTIAFVWIGA